MRILALLPAAARHAIERSVGTTHALVHEKKDHSPIETLRERKCDILVLDPAVLDDEQYAELLPLLNTVPVLLYASLTDVAAQRIVQAAELGAHELVIRGREDSADLLLHKLASLLAPSAPALLLSRAAQSFRRFPDPLRTVAVGLFGTGPLPRWVDEVSDATGLARRTVDRWMERAGIDGAATLLDAARMARVWEPVVERKLGLGEVCLECGYARPRLLASHARRIVGVLPAEFAAKFTRDRFADRLAGTLFGR
jgi:AraC-like DNA-binding protein